MCFGFLFSGDEKFFSFFFGYFPFFPPQSGRKLWKNFVFVNFFFPYNPPKGAFFLRGKRTFFLKFILGFIFFLLLVFGGAAFAGPVGGSFIAPTKKHKIIIWIFFLPTHLLFFSGTHQNLEAGGACLERKINLFPLYENNSVLWGYDFFFLRR